MAKRLPGTPFRWLFFFNLFCLSLGRSEILFVSLRGKDTEVCGSPDMPCRTIGRAVKRGLWGSTILLDGTGTEAQPYNCSSTETNVPGIHVTNSLTIIGYPSVAHVSCSNSLFFEATTGQRNMLAKLSGIAFLKTSVVFRNCDTQITNCSFKDTLQKSAVLFIAKNIAINVFLVVTDTYFGNNSRCIFADFNEDVAGLNVLIDIQNTTFKRNGLIKSPIQSGGILLSNSSMAKGLMHVQVRCQNVVYVENKGPFMDLDLLTATTDESYINLTMLANMNPDKDSTKGTLRSAKQSLYSIRSMRSKISITSIHCVDNEDVRCLDISSEDFSLTVRNSLFSGHDLKHGNGAALRITQPAGSANISVEHTEFLRNSAQEGGCVYVDNGNGTMNLYLSYVNFTQCQAYTRGSALSVGSQERSQDPGIKELTANIANTAMRNCSVLFKGSWHCGAICLYVKAGGTIQFNRASWVGNSAPICAALLVKNTKGPVHIRVNDSILTENSGRYGGLCAQSLVPFAGTVVVSNTKLVKTRTVGLLLDPKFKIRLENVTVLSSGFIGVYIKAIGLPVEFHNVNVHVENCIFEDNIVNLWSVVSPVPLVEFILKNISFRRLVSPPRLHEYYHHVPFTLLFKVLPQSRKNLDNASNAFIFLNNVTFDSTKSAVFDLRSKGRKRLEVHGSRFFNNTIKCRHGEEFCQTESSQYGGAVTILLNADHKASVNCNKRPRWAYDSLVIFENTTFEGNEGLFAGAVYVSNGYTLFRRCSFKNNVARQRGGHITISPGSGGVDIISSKFCQTKEALSISQGNGVGSQFVQFLYSESIGGVNISNTSLISCVSTSNPQSVLDIAQSDYVSIDPDSIIQCSVGSKLTLENLTHITYTEYGGRPCKLIVLKFSCGLCPPDKYSLQKGSALGSLIHQGFRCLPCPHGANCIRNIAAKPNFWGYHVSSHQPSLKFTTCPEEHCSPPHVTDTAVYNGCHGNRTGVLCGSCRRGFTESLFSTECRPVRECSRSWFWLGTLIVLICLTCYLITKPPILTFLRNQIFWFEPKTSHLQILEQDLGDVGHSQHSDSGYLKITFFFYQAADLLLVGSFASVVSKVPLAVRVLSLFKLQIQIFNDGFGCPFPGLTAVTKELFLSIGPFAVLGCVCVFYFCHRVMNCILGKEKPHLVRYLAVALETLLLGYERLAETALTLLHCIRLESNWRLFYDGNICCWQWWQTILLIYVLAFLAPFIGVLYWGSSLLQSKRTSITEFLGACVLPLPFLLHWAVRHKNGRLKDQDIEASEGTEVLEVLHGPFRKPSDQDPGSLHWESVLIGRRFILLTFHAFIKDQMMRLACMTGACMLMAFHHVIKRPYKDPKANQVETVSLLLLAFMGVMNLARATLISVGVEPSGPTVSYLEAFRWLEVALLLFIPGLIVVLAIFAILSQFVRLLIFLGSNLVRGVLALMQLGRPEEGFRIPLLATTHGADQ